MAALEFNVLFRSSADEFLTALVFYTLTTLNAFEQLIMVIGLRALSFVRLKNRNGCEKDMSRVGVLKQG